MLSIEELKNYLTEEESELSDRIMYRLYQHLNEELEAIPCMEKRRLILQNILQNLTAMLIFENNQDSNKGIKIFNQNLIGMISFVNQLFNEETH